MSPSHSLEEKLEARLDSIPRWKQIVILLPIALLVVYLAVGLLRCFAVMSRMKSPGFMPILDWWWMWIFS